MSRQGSPSFDDQISDLQDQIDGLGVGSTPTGTGFRYVTSGVEDGTARSLSASDITNAGGALASDVSSEASTRASADTALAAPSYVCMGTSATLANERVLTGTSNRIIVTDNGANGTVVLSIGTDVVTLTGTQTLTNKTLTAPRLASGGFIADANGNEAIICVTTASAVNEITLTNAATGNHPRLAASGGDTNIGLELAGKGSGGVRPRGTGGAGHYLKQSSANGAISSGAPLQNEMTYSGYYAGKTSDQSIAANTTADVTLTTNEQTSADITHSTSTNPAEFTVNTTQKYAIDFVCSALIAATTSSYQAAEFTLYVNGVAVRGAYTYTYDNGGNTHGQNAVLNWEGPITAGQIVKVTCKNNSVSNALNLRGQTSSINLTSMRIQGRGV